MQHLHPAVAAAIALSLITVGAVPVAVHAGKWQRRGQYQFQTASGSSCASPGKHSTLFLSGLHIQTGLMQTRTYERGDDTWDDCNPPNLTVCLVHLRCVSLPVWVNRTLVELNGVFSILEFTWWALKLWTNSAETGVTLTDRSTDRQVSLNKKHQQRRYIQVPLPGRCRPSGSVYCTTSAGGFLHSSERSSAPTQVKTRLCSLIKPRMLKS